MPRKQRKNRLQSGDQSQLPTDQEQETLSRGPSSSNKGGLVGDFATLSRQSDQSSESSGVASNVFETINDPLVDDKMLETIKKANKGIKDCNRKYGEIHAEHLEKSRKEILDTAQIALDRAPQGQSKKALLLGIGPSFDIPLKELTERFDHVTVVELDRESAVNAIRELSPELQKKVKLVVADMTGITSQYCHKMRDGLNNSKSLRFFLKSVKEVTDTMAEKTTEMSPGVGNNYTFACSHLVLSQLGQLPQSYVGDAVKIKFPLQLREEDNNAIWGNYFRSDSYKKLVENLQKEHILSLARSVTPSGTVHFADTPLSMKYNGPEKVTNFTFKKSVIDSLINESFLRSKKAEGWVFRERPGELEYMVSSYSLGKKGLEQLDYSVPPERSGEGTPSDVRQEPIEERDTIDSKKELERPGSTPPERSGAATPPDVRQDLTDILADPSKRDRLKQLLMEKRAREAVDGSKIKEPQDMTNDHERKIDDLQRANKLLQGQVKLLGDQVEQLTQSNEKLTQSNEKLQDQVEQLTRSRREAINAVKEELTRNFSDLLGRIQAIADRSDDE